MLRRRIIPSLLLRGRGLVKTVKFADAKYVGDPVNAVRIFNEKEVDELLLLDIDATKTNKPPQFDLVAEIAQECFMPLAYGGGVRDCESMSKLFNLGIEKVAINSAAAENPGLVREASQAFGSQSIVVSIDVKKKWLGGYEVYTEAGTKRTGLDPVTFACRMEAQGAGEILINSIDRDGTMLGYDLALVSSVSHSVGIPVVACGGAGKMQDLSDVIKLGGASAAAAGSMFVFQGKHRAVLISYPEYRELEQLLA